MQNVVRPGQPQHHREIHRIVFVRDRVVFQGVLHIAGRVALVRQRLRLARDFALRSLAAVSQGLRILQGGADTVGQVVVIALENGIEQRPRPCLVASPQLQQAELRGGQPVVRGILVQDLELLVGLVAVAQLEVKVREIAAQLDVHRIEFQRPLEFARVWISRGQQLHGLLAHARLCAS